MTVKCLVLYFVVAMPSAAYDFSPEKMAFYRDKVKSMFYHAYNGYLQHAYPLDELKPITCTGTDTWGSFSLTLIDALDTLVVLGNHSEFQRVVALVEDRIDFDADVNVSVFETNIRVIGGLLSAHMLSKMAGVQVEDGWPCSGPLLRLAERVANKLLPAFNTFTGMPYGTVNLKRGVHKLETPITCTAGVGTFLLEFGTVSRLTGSPHLERIADKALSELWRLRSGIGLVGNHVNVQSGVWTATDAGIGAGVDSYFEYLVKGAVMFDKPELMQQFREYENAINSYLKQDDWFVWASMTKGQVTMPIFQSLEAFWPGLLSLTGKIDAAMRSVMNYYQIMKQFGFTPEFYNIPSSEAVQKRSGYPLRPELAESLMYLYRATKDPLLLQIGAELVDAIEHSSKTSCGYATVYDVQNHIIEDRMESFFLAETTKYLYLLFDPSNFVHNAGSQGTVIHTPSGQCLVYSGGYIFNTEAHILDPSMLYCCEAKRQNDVKILADFEDNLNLLALFGLQEGSEENYLLPEDDFGYGSENDNDATSVTVPVKPAVTLKPPKSDRSPVADTFMSALDELMKEWQGILKVAAGKLADQFSHRTSEGSKCPGKDHVCRIVDMDREYTGFNIMLNYIYRGSSPPGSKPLYPFCHADEGDAEAEKENNSYSNQPPNLDGLQDQYFDSLTRNTVSRINPVVFKLQPHNLSHYDMSCPLLPFSFRITGLGEVMPER